MLKLSAVVLPVYIQMLGGLENVLAAARIACDASGEDETAFVKARLAPDMLDFSWQVQSAATNSLVGLRGAMAGRYELDLTEPADTLPGLTKRVVATRAEIEALDPCDIDALVGRDVLHVPRGVVFSAEAFITGFSMPNFYFHLVTAYDIMRSKGVPIGKSHYLGRLPVRY